MKKEFGRNIMLLPPITYYRRCENSRYEFAGHSHGHWELKIMLDGELEVTYENTVLTLRAGDLMINEPNAFHREVTDDADYAVLSFHCSDIPITGKPRVVQLSSDDLELARLTVGFADRYSTNKEKGLLDGEKINFTLIKLLEVLIYKVLGSETFENASLSKSTAAYTAVVDFMRRNLDRNLTVSEISRRCGIGPTVLKGIISRYTGQGVIAHHMELRIDRAKQLLRDGMSVGEVSDTLGFSSQSYFTQCFRRKCGCTPTQYRSSVD